MRKTKDAFNWIISILEKHEVKYRISGGFAARVYGSNRKLADIDIEIQDKDFNKILPEIQSHIKEGPKRYKDDLMDTFGLSMAYKGQAIDISGTQTERLFDIRKNKWVKSKINLSKITWKKIYGKRVSVITKKDLITYKKIIRRKVDILDIAAIS
jgi:hypothetical protein